VHGKISTLLCLIGGIGQTIGSTEKSNQEIPSRGITITQQHIDMAKAFVDHIFPYGEQHSQNQTSTAKSKNTKIEETISATAPNAVIRVGVFPDRLPFIAKQKDHFVGLETDLIQLIARRENLNCEFHCMNAMEMKQKLHDTAIDIAIGALVMDAITDKNFESSNGYLHTECGVIMPKKYKRNITKKLSFTGKKIGVLENAYPMACMQLDCIQGTEITTFSSIVEMINALQQKLLDFAIIGKDMAQYWIAKNPELTYISLNISQEYVFYGIKDSSCLKMINCGIDKLLGTQKFMELKDRWSIGKN
jgi:ABC-type amino acid transport substrate-binding protein